MSHLIIRRLAATIVMLFIAVGLAPPVSAQAITFDSGHVDAFHVSTDGGSLVLDLKEDVTGTGVRHSPEGVHLVVSDAAFTDTTAQINEIGQATYFLPQTQNQAILWPGWDTQSAEGFRAIDFHFHEVSGPGEVMLFESSGFGELTSVLSSGGYALSTGQVIQQPYPAHRHVNWAFTAPGTYRMVVSAQGADASGQVQTSNQATYTWVVGSGDAPAPAPLIDAAPAPAAAPAAAPRAAQAAPSSGTCTPGVTPMIKDDRTVPPVWKATTEVEFSLGESAVKELPAPIGSVPAGKVWIIGSTQEQGVPWVGANTQHPSMREHTSGDVTWELTSFAGPGPMTVYTQGGLGQMVGDEWFRATPDQVQGSHAIAPNSHVHPSWVFGAPGTYQVSIRQSVALKDGSRVSGSGVITFQVGNGAGNAGDGHFDLGGVVDPAGGDCAPAAPGGAVGAADGPAAAAPGQTLATPVTSLTAASQEPRDLTIPVAILTAGLVVLVGGTVSYIVMLRRQIPA
ncbi:cell surface protein [Corynebacterium testudinoris]|uniref:Actinobacterial surface-anchored protein domain n=1 Tax=Corynebacterium testudinoris TaxID=136857 RepID=A0A0G3H741_9CORY|nr:choice-of-anchor M domain-containing protein [Corynebacterium testudinoris]AKK08605.1 actinobacterial surface-anchored protein domain [Corynebacterium testudinoris]MBX8997002.1 cell surface protein [Corynebacterium testudinoris]